MIIYSLRVAPCGIYWRWRLVYNAGDSPRWVRYGAITRLIPSRETLAGIRACSGRVTKGVGNVAASGFDWMGDGRYRHPRRSGFAARRHPHADIRCGKNPQGAVQAILGRCIQWGPLIDDSD